MSSVRHIPLGRTLKVATVDEHNFGWLSEHTWGVTGQNKSHTLTSYAVSIKYNDGKRKLMHRAIMERKLGRPLGRHELVDHIDHDGLNNLESNLRIATQQENLRNRMPKSKYGVKGVTFREKAWYAAITIDGKLTHLGLYRTKEDAARAYDAAARYYFGEFARTNFEGTEKLTVGELVERAKSYNRATTLRPKSSQYQGVSKQRNRWAVIVRINMERHYVGLYKTELEAAQAYDTFVKEKLGNRAKLNFPADNTSTMQE